MPGMHRGRRLRCRSASAPCSTLDAACTKSQAAATGAYNTGLPTTCAKHPRATWHGVAIRFCPFEIGGTWLVCLRAYGHCSNLASPPPRRVLRHGVSSLGADWLTNAGGGEEHVCACITAAPRHTPKHPSVPRAKTLATPHLHGDFHDRYQSSVPAVPQHIQRRKRKPQGLLST